MRTRLKKLFLVPGLLALLWMGLSASLQTSPVVVLHYSAAANDPVGYFFNENDDLTRDYLKPGTSVEFRTPHHPPADYFIELSLPLASREGVQIKQPYSRVDVYIDADKKISRTVIQTDFLARFGANEKAQ